MKPLSDSPQIGEWFCFPQSVVLIDGRNRYKKHRWIVVGSGLITINIPVLLRSTKSRYGGIQHEAHNGDCGFVTCRIDKPGWISILKYIRKEQFTPERKSCKEPSDLIITKAMQQASDLRKPKKTRKSR